VIDGLTGPHLLIQRPVDAESRRLDKQKPKRMSKTISVQFSLGCEPSAKGRRGDSIGQDCIQDYKEGSGENSLTKAQSSLEEPEPTDSGVAQHMEGNELARPWHRR
jgi:hypothetical protein